MRVLRVIEERASTSRGGSALRKTQGELVCVPAWAERLAGGAREVACRWLSGISSARSGILASFALLAAQLVGCIAQRNETTHFPFGAGIC